MLYNVYMSRELDLFSKPSRSISKEQPPSAIDAAHDLILQQDHPYTKDECVDIFEKIVFPSLNLRYSEDSLREKYPDIANADGASQRFIFYGRRTDENSAECLWVRVVRNDPGSYRIGTSICLDIIYKFPEAAQLRNSLSHLQ